MTGKTQRHARGSVVLNRRAGGEHVWYFRFKDARGKYRGEPFATISQCRNKSLARIEADRLRLAEKFIGPVQAEREGRKNFGQLIARYKAEEMPERFGTRHGYESWLNLHIAPKWEASLIDDVEPALVQSWLKELALAPKSKAHIKGLMTILFDHAMKWKWVPLTRNPMELVKIKGGTRRRTRPQIMSIEQWAKFIKRVEEEHVRVIVVIGMCLGLRLSEILALKWLDVDWEGLTLYVRRGIVQGRIGPVKTEYSEAPAPLDPDLAEILLDLRRVTDFAGDDDWMFASPFKCGRAPYFPTAVRRKIHAAAKAAGLAELFQGEPTKIMRHSYRSWLGTTDAPIAVIKDLMRHADIRTTMNEYGNGMQPAMRKANAKVVRMVLKTGKKARVKSVSFA